MVSFILYHSRPRKHRSAKQPPVRHRFSSRLPRSHCYLLPGHMIHMIHIHRAWKIQKREPSAAQPSEPHLRSTALGDRLISFFAAFGLVTSTFFERSTRYHALVASGVWWHSPGSNKSCVYMFLSYSELCFLVILLFILNIHIHISYVSIHIYNIT